MILKIQLFVISYLEQKHTRDSSNDFDAFYFFLSLSLIQLEKAVKGLSPNYFQILFDINRLMFA